MKKLFLPLLIVGTFTFGCKKKNDVKVDDPPKDNTECQHAYLPVLIEADNYKLDSIIYNNDQTVARWYFMKMLGDWQYTYDFSYNAEGKCNVITETVLAAGRKKNIYSFTYTNNHVNVTRRNSNGEVVRSLEFTMNDKGQVILCGSKDTVYTQSDRNVNYTELKYNNNNIEEWIDYDYTKWENGDENLYTTLYTMKYDDKPSLFNRLFAKNPVLQMLFMIIRPTELYTFAKNNVTDITIVTEWLGHTDTTKLPINNVFDNNTGMLSARKIGIDDMYRFYIKKF
ncbi:hypothetical protein DVR12_05995 [Chitinophaga silvatica]|uniref:DUF4595 domain-containing protein n=1 Tax=Chitinophaga silvatica TaxID=2282649 RepID=A0A3E1YEN0_9BACT|nr:hypothetical protein [Chitinophaga silvatica]RFS24747.1 hypothetical protein DVR12_05995 [Chitinophaga silvatica]